MKTFALTASGLAALALVESVTTCTETPPSTAAVGSTLRMHATAGPAVAVDLLEDGAGPLCPTHHSPPVPLIFRTT
jgi:hypothetical protein